MYELHNQSQVSKYHARRQSTSVHTHAVYEVRRSPLMEPRLFGKTVRTFLSENAELPEVRSSGGAMS